MKYLVLLLALIVAGCAKRGSITGGLKDTIPPVMTTSSPENFSTGFKGKTIRLTFNEYIKLKNLNKQLIISPPMNTQPVISPTTASKYINIKILDTLKENTTYSFNFGQSIEDNNESNPYPLFKYVFSTGTYIDSLTLGGRVKDAYAKKADNFVSVMLYEVDENYNDSIVYTKAPRYITNTLDSITMFKLDYLKAGKYRLIALKDENGNNHYDPKTDKIGFQKEFVTIPNDTIYELELFKEEAPFKAIRPTQASGNRIVFGFEGKPVNLSVTLRNGSEILPSAVTRLQQKDSIQVWYQPIKVDSLQLSVQNANYKSDFTVKMRAQKKDTLSFSPLQTGTLRSRDVFTIKASRPLIAIDSSFISVMNKDSVAVRFKTAYDGFNQDLKIDFEREPLQKYVVTLLPGAATDFYQQKNDTLTYRLSTKSLADYGIMRVALRNVRQYPIIVELTNSKGEIIASEYVETDRPLEFAGLDPSLYMLRVIYDENKNREWDPGNFIQQRQSEPVYYFPDAINVPANWDFEQTFTLP